MDSDHPGPSSGSWRKVLLGVLVLNALWLGRGVIDPGFRNLDVTGIVYNARLLLVGKLPYLNSAEVKPPGAFVLLAPALWLWGLRGVWLLGVVWASLTSLKPSLGGWLASVWTKPVAPTSCCWRAILSVATG